MVKGSNTTPVISQQPLKIGVDPEFFTIDTDLGIYVSAHTLVPGSKDAPYKVECGAMQVDGCAIEFNTDPAETSKEFVRNLKTVQEQIRKHVPEKYEFRYEPVVYFDKYYFEKKIPDGPKELGCNPDYNAYTGLINPRPVPSKKMSCARTGSGHIHLGWTSGADCNSPSHRYDCEAVVQALEATILPFSRLWDSDQDRKNIYGKPGALRYKPYGVEWRTLSNAWLNHPEIWEWLFDACSFVIDGMRKGDILPIHNYGYAATRLKQYLTAFNKVYLNGATKIDLDQLNAFTEHSHPGFPAMPYLKDMEPGEVAPQKELNAYDDYEYDDLIYDDF